VRGDFLALGDQLKLLLVNIGRVEHNDDINEEGNVDPVVAQNPASFDLIRVQSKGNLPGGLNRHEQKQERDIHVPSHLEVRFWMDQAF